MDLATIAAGVAARFAGVTATNGTATETATATHLLPNNVGTLALLVYPPEADLDLVPGPRLDDHYIFPVRLLRDPVDVPTRSAWLYAWATALRTKVQANVDLDVSGVHEAKATSMRLSLDGVQYASASGGLQDFDLVEVLVDVHVFENTTVSP